MRRFHLVANMFFGVAGLATIIYSFTPGGSKVDAAIGLACLALSNCEGILARLEE